MPTRSRNSAALLAALLLLPSCHQTAAGEGTVDKPALGLFTTLPIYWGEGDFGDIIDGAGEPDWVRTELERDYALEPLDTLEAESLAGLDRIVLAQPRPLAPSENVALDDWVAGGGRALIFADPMLTRPSGFAVGDRRRPQDVVLLSPILARWGLELRFDAEQAEGEREIEALGMALPVNLHGTFAPTDGESVADCTIAASGLLARCTRGEGQVLLIADAALLDDEGETADAESRIRALDRLLESLFG